MKKRNYLWICVLFLLILTAVPVSAAEKKNSWYVKNGRYYYYNAKGELSKGTKKINGKYYYFNCNGRQRNGWIVSKGNYYFYKNSAGKGGYRLDSTTVNGIQLQKNGQAVVTNQNKTKLRLLVKANIYAYLNSDLTMSMEQRLKKCFNKMVYGVHYRNIHSFRLSSNWAEYYAAYVLDHNYGDCYCAGSAFAFVATAIGFKNVYAVSSGGHGWCVIGEKAYDPNWARMTGRTEHYFGLTRNGLTKNDPNYFRYGIYKARID